MEAAENTLSAFDKALSYGAQGLETDIQLTLDEVPVLWHDRFLDKIGRPAKRIDDFTFAQLQAMDFSGYFSPSSAPEGIVSLEAFIRSYARQCHLLLEVKNRQWERPERHAIKMRRCLDLLGQLVEPDSERAIFVSSFHLESLVYGYRYNASWPFIYNTETLRSAAGVHALLERSPFLHGFCLPIENLNEELIEAARQRNKLIATYTCNSEDAIEKALQLEVDILITDQPAKALQLRN